MIDAGLLAHFAKGGNEDAFRKLVEQHSHMVYSTCLRQLGNAEMAEDASQSVFVVLARKAKNIRISKRRTLSAWLFRTAHFVVSHMKREQARRKKREAEAAALANESRIPKEETQWNEIREHLDSAILSLGTKQQQAVIGYFLEGKTQKKVGEELGCSEDAARMRINNALGKLRRKLVKKGIAPAAGALASLLAAESLQAAPASIAESCHAAAMAGIRGETAATAGFTNVHLTAKGTIKMMMWAKAKMLAAVCACVVLMGFCGVTAATKLAPAGPDTKYFRQLPADTRDPCTESNAFTKALRNLGDGRKDIVFLIDNSVSVRKDNKIFRIKEALEDCLRTALSPQDRFDIIFFDKETHPFKNSLVRANTKNIEEACRYIDGLQAGYLTDMKKALDSAFRMNPMVIFLVSDGFPSCGIKGPTELRKAVKAGNIGLGIRIDTFSLVYRKGVYSKSGITAKEFLECLAKENSGHLREIELVRKIPLGTGPSGSIYLYHDKHIKIFNPQTGSLLKSIRVNAGRIQDGARDAQGNFYFLGRFNNKVTVFNPQGKELTAFRCQNEPDSEYIGCDCSYITVDPVRNTIYLSDTNNNRILVYNKTGEFQCHFGSTGIRKTRTYRDRSSGRIDDITGEVIPPGEEFTVSETYIEPNSRPGYFCSPSQLLSDEKTGSIYVNDRGNQRLQTFDAGTKFLEIATLDGIRDYGAIKSLKLGRSCRFYVGYKFWRSFSTIKIFNPQGRLTREFRATSIREGVPDFLIVDPQELRLYVSHKTSDKVKVFDREGAFLTAFSILQD